MQATTNVERADFGAIKARQQATWSDGNYSVIGSTLSLISELLVDGVDPEAGWRVLDVATGNGNAALAAARYGCEVTGVDYVPALLEDGKRRAQAEGLPVTFTEGDAEALPFPDSSFDAVLSTLGVMFAPDQEKTAAELLRVCRRGGRIGLANWTPDSFVGQMFKVIGRHVPPPAGVRSPALWGTKERVSELLGDGVSSLQASRRQFVFRYTSPQQWLESFRTYYGPMVRAFAALESEQQKRLAEDLLELAGTMNRAAGPVMSVPSDYLEIVAIRA
jgi:ubiquinone/menaquinone biosynthesis C-methylase UbiE